MWLVLLGVGFLVGGAAGAKVAAAASRVFLQWTFVPYLIVLGAIVVNFAKTYFTGVFPEYWLFGLGALFVLVTLFLPKGILGWLSSLRRKPTPAPPASLAETSTIAEEGGSAQ